MPPAGPSTTPSASIPRRIIDIIMCYYIIICYNIFILYTGRALDDALRLCSQARN